MPKEQTLTSIDSELKKKAKEALLNISAITEDAIRQKLNQKTIEANVPLICEFCGTQGEKETAGDVRESMRKAFEAGTKLPTEHSDKTKLTWLWPEEQWICNRCLLEKIRRVPIGQ